MIIIEEKRYVARNILLLLYFYYECIIPFILTRCISFNLIAKGEKF